MYGQKNGVNLKQVRKKFVTESLPSMSESHSESASTNYTTALTHAPASNSSSSSSAKKKDPRELLLIAFNSHVDKLRSAIQVAAPNPTSSTKSVPSVPRELRPRTASSSATITKTSSENEECASEVAPDVDDHMNFEGSIQSPAASRETSTGTGGGNRSAHRETDIVGPSAMSSSGTGSAQLTRKQILSNAALERRRVQRRLSQQSDGSTTEEAVTDTKINDAILSSALDRLQSLFTRQYKPAPTQVWASRKRNGKEAVRANFPYIPIKKQVGWVHSSRQDIRNPSVPLSEELRLFESYVSVSVGVDSRILVDNLQI